MDSYSRTLAKTAGYRIVTFGLTYWITLIVTGAVTTSAVMAVMSISIGSLSYIVHERIWTSIRWASSNGDESAIRSLCKTITYRVWSLTVVFILGLILGLKQQEAAIMTLALNIMYMVSHYSNERIWNKIPWGKQGSDGVRGSRK